MNHLYPATKPPTSNFDPSVSAPPCDSKMRYKHSPDKGQKERIQTILKEEVYLQALLQSSKFCRLRCSLKDFVTYFCLNCKKLSSIAELFLVGSSASYIAAHSPRRRDYDFRIWLPSDSGINRKATDLFVYKFFQHLIKVQFPSEVLHAAETEINTSLDGTSVTYTFGAIDLNYRSKIVTPLSVNKSDGFVIKLPQGEISCIDQTRYCLTQDSFQKAIEDIHHFRYPIENTETLKNIEMRILSKIIHRYEIVPSSYLTQFEERLRKEYASESPPSPTLPWTGRKNFVLSYSKHLLTLFAPPCTEQTAWLVCFLDLFNLLALISPSDSSFFNLISRAWTPPIPDVTSALTPPLLCLQLHNPSHTFAVLNFIYGVAICEKMYEPSKQRILFKSEERSYALITRTKGRPLAFEKILASFLSSVNTITFLIKQEPQIFESLAILFEHLTFKSLNFLPATISRYVQTLFTHLSPDIESSSALLGPFYAQVLDGPFAADLKELARARLSHGLPIKKQDRPYQTKSVQVAVETSHQEPSNSLIAMTSSSPPSKGDTNRETTKRFAIKHTNCFPHPLLDSFPLLHAKENLEPMDSLAIKIITILRKKQARISQNQLAWAVTALVETSRRQTLPLEKVTVWIEEVCRRSVESKIMMRKQQDDLLYLLSQLHLSVPQNARPASLKSLISLVSERIAFCSKRTDKIRHLYWNAMSLEIAYRFSASSLRRGCLPVVPLQMLNMPPNRRLLLPKFRELACRIVLTSPFLTTPEAVSELMQSFIDFPPAQDDFKTFLFILNLAQYISTKYLTSTSAIGRYPHLYSTILKQVDAFFKTNTKYTTTLALQIDALFPPPPSESSDELHSLSRIKFQNMIFYFLRQKAYQKLKNPIERAQHELSRSQYEDFKTWIGHLAETLYRNILPTPHISSERICRKIIQDINEIFIIYNYRQDLLNKLLKNIIHFFSIQKQSIEDYQLVLEAISLLDKIQSDNETYFLGMLQLLSSLCKDPHLVKKLDFLKIIQHHLRLLSAESIRTFSDYKEQCETLINLHYQIGQNFFMASLIHQKPQLFLNFVEQQVMPFTQSLSQFDPKLFDLIIRIYGKLCMENTATAYIIETLPYLTIPSNATHRTKRKIRSAIQSRKKGRLSFHIIISKPDFTKIKEHVNKPNFSKSLETIYLKQKVEGQVNPSMEEAVRFYQLVDHYIPASNTGYKIMQASHEKLYLITQQTILNKTTIKWLEICLKTSMEFEKHF